jgi:hypothetical protein
MLVRERRLIVLSRHQLLTADPKTGEDALRNAGSIGASVTVQIIRKSPDRMAKFGDRCAVVATVGIDIRWSQTATITEGDLIRVGAEMFEIIGELIDEAFKLV